MLKRLKSVSMLLFLMGASIFKGYLFLDETSFTPVWSHL